MPFDPMTFASSVQSTATDVEIQLRKNYIENDYRADGMSKDSIPKDVLADCPFPPPGEVANISAVPSSFSWYAGRSSSDIAEKYNAICSVRDGFEPGSLIGDIKASTQGWSGDTVNGFRSFLRDLQTTQKDQHDAFMMLVNSCDLMHQVLKTTEDDIREVATKTEKALRDLLPHGSGSSTTVVLGILGFVLAAGSPGGLVSRGIGMTSKALSSINGAFGGNGQEISGNSVQEVLSSMETAMENVKTGLRNAEQSLADALRADTGLVFDAGLTADRPGMSDSSGGTGIHGSYPLTIGPGR